MASGVLQVSVLELTILSMFNNDAETNMLNSCCLLPYDIKMVIVDLEEDIGQLKPGHLCGTDSKPSQVATCDICERI